MKLLQEIHSEVVKRDEVKQLDEAGLIKKGLGKVAGAVGMKGTAANLQAQGEAAQKVKQLKIAFNQFAGQMGKSLKNASANDLTTFLKSKNLPISDAIKKMGNQPLNQVDKNTINQAFQVAIQGGAKRQVRQQAQQAGQPQQPQQPQAVGGKVSNIAKALAQLSPSAKNSLIAALQS